MSTGVLIYFALLALTSIAPASTIEALTLTKRLRADESKSNDAKDLDFDVGDPRNWSLSPHVGTQSTSHKVGEANGNIAEFYAEERPDDLYLEETTGQDDLYGAFLSNSAASNGSSKISAFGRSYPAVAGARREFSLVRPSAVLSPSQGPPFVAPTLATNPYLSPAAQQLSASTGEYEEEVSADLDDLVTQDFASAAGSLDIEGSSKNSGTDRVTDTVNLTEKKSSDSEHFATDDISSRTSSQSPHSPTRQAEGELGQGLKRAKMLVEQLDKLYSANLDEFDDVDFEERSEQWKKDLNGVRIKSTLTLTPRVEEKRFDPREERRLKSTINEDEYFGGRVLPEQQDTRQFSMQKFGHAHNTSLTFDQDSAFSAAGIAPTPPARGELRLDDIDTEESGGDGGLSDIGSDSIIVEEDAECYEDCTDSQVAQQLAEAQEAAKRMADKYLGDKNLKAKAKTAPKIFTFTDEDISNSRKIVRERKRQITHYTESRREYMPLREFRPPLTDKSLNQEFWGRSFRNHDESDKVCKILTPKSLMFRRRERAQRKIQEKKVVEWIANMKRIVGYNFIMTLLKVKMYLRKYVRVWKKLKRDRLSRELGFEKLKKFVTRKKQREVYKLLAVGLLIAQYDPSVKENNELLQHINREIVQAEPELIIQPPKPSDIDEFSKPMDVSQSRSFETRPQPILLPQSPHKNNRNESSGGTSKITKSPSAKKQTLGKEPSNWTLLSSTIDVPAFWTGDLRETISVLRLALEIRNSVIYSSYRYCQAARMFPEQFYQGGVFLISFSDTERAKKLFQLLRNSPKKYAEPFDPTSVVSPEFARKGTKYEDFHFPHKDQAFVCGLQRLRQLQEQIVRDQRDEHSPTKDMSRTDMMQKELSPYSSGYSSPALTAGAYDYSPSPENMMFFAGPTSGNNKISSKSGPEYFI